LANAFYVADVPYRWQRGVVYRLASCIPLRRERYEIAYAQT
jgi:hypothetical protein